MDKKKIVKISAISLILIAVLLAGIIGVKAYIMHRNLAETGNVLGVEWYNQTDPQFTITTVEQLYELADLSDFYDFKGQTIKLDADIVVNEGNAEAWAKNAPEKRWNPITGFAGIFDGQNHTISGLYGKGFERRMALFADTAMSCSVKNLSLVNSYFETIGHRGTASIVSHGGGKFSKIYSDAIIVHKGENVGGIASTIDEQATFEECWFDGDINITSRDCGGIVDEVLGARVTVKHCLFSGHIYSSYNVGGTRTGGIFGRVDKSATIVLNDSLSSGTIECDKTVYTGSMLGASYNGVQFTIADTYVSAETYAATIGESGKKGSFTGTALQMGASELTGVKAYQWTTLNFDSYWAVVEDGTPVLKHFAKTVPSLEGVKKVYDTSWYIQGGFDFTLMTREQLYGFFILSASTDYQDCKIKLGADIVVNEGDASKWAKVAPKMPWYPIATFAGQFDGQGHTISGLYSKASSSYVGFFGQATATSVIQNVSLKNCYFEKTGTSAAFMGSVAGDTYGVVKNVYSDAIIVSEGNQVGGIVGRLNDNDKTMSSTRIDGEDYSLMSNCWFDGSITMLAGKEENTGACEAGGLVGRVVQGDAIIEHCLNTGTISSSVTGRALMVGGLVGYVVNAGQLNITDCLNVGEVKTDYTICVGSVIGRANTKERIVTVKNTYATTESYKKAISTNSLKATIKGDVISVDKSLIEGKKGYQFTTLDFNKYWTIVVSPDKTPILSQFANKKPSVKGLTKMVDLSWYKSDAKELVIDSAADLYGFAMLSKTNNFEGKTVKLTKSVHLDPKLEWIPIGSASTPFAGTFDGGMNTITGMRVNSETSYIGMFAVTSPTSMVKRFYLEDSEFIYSGPSLKYNEEKGKDEEVGAYMGSIVGDLRGDLDTVYSSATVKSVAMQVGGLVGRANGIKVDEKYTTSTINNCWFDGQVVLTGETARYAGGIAGVAIQGNIEITNCLNTGSVSNERLNGGVFLGGLLGTDWGKSTIHISDSVSAGTVTAANVNCIGSIMGRVQKSGSEVTITNTYAMKGCCTKEDGTKDVSLWSVANGATVTNETVFASESELLGVEAYKWTNLNFDATTGTWVARKEQIPRLKSFAKKGEEKSLAGVIKPNTSWYDNAAKDATDYYIGTPEELLGFAKLYNSGNVFKGKTIHLTDDIRLNPKNVVTDYVNETSDEEPDNRWVPGGNNTVSTQFAGTFDGQGHTISGIYTVSDSSYIGLFGVIADGSVVKDLSITDSYFYSSNTGNAMIGSVAGECRGTIDSVYSEAIVESSGDRVGGLVGMASGPKPAGKTKYGTATINNSWFNGTINLLDGATNSGGVIGLTMQGNVNVTNCLVTGTINNATAKTDGGLIGFVGNAGAHNMIVNISDNLVALKKEVANANVGNVIGTIKNNDSGTTFTRSYTIINTYVTEESFAGNSIIAHNKEDDTTAVVGTALIKAKSDLQGTKGYENTLLDFYVNADDQGDWVARSGKVPALKTFVGTVVDDAEVAKLGSASQTGWYDDSIDTYYIGTVSAFKAFRDYVNSGKTFSGKTVYLTDDMDLNPGWTAPEDTSKAVSGEPEEWTTIGDNGKKFQGTFDGQKHTIKGVYVDKNASYVGVFGNAENATICNFNITNSYFKQSGTDYHWTGSAIGNLGKGGLVSNIYSDAVIVSQGRQIGGIVGRADATVEECWFDGEIKATRGSASIFAGGIVGASNNSANLIVKDCLSAGKIIYNYNPSSTGTASVGGIYGGTYGATPKITIQDCVFSNVITVKNTVVGAVAGLINKADTEYEISNCYVRTDAISNQTVSATDGILGGTANSPEGSVLKCVAKKLSELQGEVVYEHVLNGGLDLDYGVWAARTSDVPVPRCFVGTAVDKSAIAEDKTGRVYADTSWLENNAGTESDPYQLDSAGDLLGFAQLVNNGMNFQSLFVELTADIDMNAGWTATIDEQTGKISGKVPRNIWTPIGGVSTSVYFNGTFDGNGHTISGIYVDTKATEYTGFAGLFGFAMAASTIENFQLVNSYIESGNANTGSIVGRFGGTMNNVYSNATVFGVGTTGGLVGLYTEGGNKTIQKCWFDGTVTAAGNATYCGGIVACTDKKDKTKTVKNCLNTGKVTCEYAGDNNNVATATGGIAGGNKSGTLKVENCLNLGAVSTPKDVNRTNKNKGTAAIVGYNAKDHSVTVQDSYYTNSEWNAVGFNNKGTVTLKLNGNTVTSLTSNTVAELTGAKAAQNAPYLGISDSGAWTTLKVQENNQVKEMTPILKDFKAWWLDEHNYTKNLLMIGNSFSYYYVEELYGIAEAAGVHLNIYNVYKSGCTLGEHWDWLQSDEKNYDFYVTNADGRRKALSGKVGLKDCLAVADWDIISLQQASTTYIDTVETAKALTEPYAQNLYGYLREKFPNARYLWHQTWSSQIGYQHATDANNKVQDREAQKLRDANAVGLASYICQTYNVENVPSGSAWDIARKNALIGDTLCNRVNSSGVDDTDNHHDGNVGGGQYLNACVWFETLTGKSCVGNTYRPDDYDISEDKIAVLQQSAHEAVKAIYGETE